MEKHTPSDGLFALNPRAQATMEVLGGQLPVLLVDDVFSDPAQLRARALELPYAEPGTAYPGKLAQPDLDDHSLQFFLGRVLALANEQYLPRVPPIAADGQQIVRFQSIHADFAITDRHPDQLEPTQRKPHTDPVPIFGLVYLNPEPRGGTLFFNPVSSASGEPSVGGYYSGADAAFRLVGRIDGSFNRLAIYPGFVPHSGEIEGDWIRTDERFNYPRLTLRLAFLP
jgi:Family of unknown function (DUF6445)